MRRLIIITLSTLGIGIFILAIFLLSPFAITHIRIQTQVETQKQEGQERSNNPPSESQIEEMKLKGSLCYHNNDCVGNINTLRDCNGPVYNKYYCSTNTCYSTMIGCPEHFFSVCENNTCVTKSITANLFN